MIVRNWRVEHDVLGGGIFNELEHRGLSAKIDQSLADAKCHVVRNRKHSKLQG